MQTPIPAQSLKSNRASFANLQLPPNNFLSPGINSTSKENPRQSMKKISIDDFSTLRTTQRPGTAKATSKKQDSKFDLVCTSQSAFRIKSKLDSTAFGKASNKPKDSQVDTRRLSDSMEDTLHSDFRLGQNKIRGISPNMVIKAAKTDKEEQLEEQIKELFENEPLFNFIENVNRIQSYPVSPTP